MKKNVSNWFEVRKAYKSLVSWQRMRSLPVETLTIIFFQSRNCLAARLLLEEVICGKIYGRFLCLREMETKRVN